MAVLTFSSAASLVDQRVLPACNVGGLSLILSGQEDPLEKEIATRLSTLAWKIPRMEGAGRLQVHGLQRVTHN